MLSIAVTYMPGKNEKLVITLTPRRMAAAARPLRPATPPATNPASGPRDGGDAFAECRRSCRRI